MEVPSDPLALSVLLQPRETVRPLDSLHIQGLVGDLATLEELDAIEARAMEESARNPGGKPRFHEMKGI